MKIGRLMPESFLYIEVKNLKSSFLFDRYKEIVFAGFADSNGIVKIKNPQFVEFEDKNVQEITIRIVANFLKEEENKFASHLIFALK